MTKYIKTKDGKFAGSIGDGKTRTPATAPTVAHLPAAASRDLADLPTPGPLHTVPQYFLDTDTGYFFADSPLALPGRPSVEERQSWQTVRKQTELEHEFLHGDTGIFAALHTTPTSLYFNQALQDVKVRAEKRAQALRSEGKHHQAAAVEWVALSANNICSELYRAGEDVEFYAGTEDSRFVPGDSALVLVRDTDREYIVRYSSVGEYEATVSMEEESDEPHFVIPVDTMRSDAREMFTAAVVMDYLTIAGGDVESAAILSGLDD